MKYRIILPNRKEPMIVDGEGLKKLQGMIKRNNAKVDPVVPEKPKETKKVVKQIKK